jgi:hypothetical protein
MLRRQRFGDLIERQLDLFERDNSELLRACAEASRSYDGAPRDEAEERFGDYQALLEEASDALADLRDGYASTLDDSKAYLREFERACDRRLPDLRPI